MEGMFAENKKFSIGFTGSSEPLPAFQIATLQKSIIKYTEGKECEVHNGCCINGDEVCMNLVLEFAPHAKLVYHPPDNTYKMFKYSLRKGDEQRKPLPYLKRNLGIVAESNFLIATPKTVKEELRSGTWSTVHYARIAEIPILLIFPNGSTRLEGAK